MSLRARHIQGRLNVIADQLSREGQILPREWQLPPDLVAQIFLKWGTPNVDLFATRFNAQLPMFMFPVPDPKALEADAESTVSLHQGKWKIFQDWCRDQDLIPLQVSVP